VLIAERIFMMKNAKKFFEEIIKTEEAKALLVEVANSETEEEIIADYIDVAKKLGVELTAEEIKAYLAASVKEIFGEIDDSELSRLAGGANEGCGAASSMEIL
jgi:hypothetical protein